MPHVDPLRSIAALLRVYITVSVCLGGLYASQAGSTKTISFDIPAAIAADSLKRFSTQSGIEVIIEADLGRTVRTQEVRGEMLPREAIRRMLLGTGLEVVEGQKSGALAVKRAQSNPLGGAPTVSLGSRVSSLNSGEQGVPPSSDRAP